MLSLATVLSELLTASKIAKILIKPLLFPVHLFYDLPLSRIVHFQLPHGASFGSQLFTRARQKLS
jgi:hypothetical protein